MFRWLTVPILGLLCGCTAPQDKKFSAEYLIDSRNFSTLSVYGGAKLYRTKVFGYTDFNSGGEGSDLTKFVGRLRAVRPLYNVFGVTAEYKDGSGEGNSVAGAGISCSLNGFEARAYPYRDDRSQEFGISFRKDFTGCFSPYIRGFADVKNNHRNLSLSSEVQIGLKTISNNSRVAVEFRYSDSNRKSGIDPFGVAVGLGLDF